MQKAEEKEASALLATLVVFGVQGRRVATVESGDGGRHLGRVGGKERSRKASESSSRK